MSKVAAKETGEGYAYCIQAALLSAVIQTASLPLYLEAMSTVERQFDASATVLDDDGRHRCCWAMGQRRPGSGGRKGE